MPETAQTIDRVTYVGHATVLVELDGVRLLTDPVLRRHVLHLRRSGIAAPEASEISTPCSSLTRTGTTSTSARSGSSRRTFASSSRAGAGRSFARRRFTDVVELDAGETTSRSATSSVTATHAEHDAGRGPLRAARARARLPRHGLEAHLLRRRHGSVPRDGGARPARSRTAAGLGLGAAPACRPSRPARAPPRRCACSEPRAAVPIHWGTYSRSSPAGEQRGSTRERRPTSSRGSPRSWRRRSTSACWRPASR